MGWSRIDMATRAGVIVTLSLLPACSRQPAASARTEDRIAVIALRTAPVPAARSDDVPPRPAAPPAKPTGPPLMQPHKTFVDPPLPPELRDDGGLIPLPPAPTPTPGPR